MCGTGKQSTSLGKSCGPCYNVGNRFGRIYGCIYCFTAHAILVAKLSGIAMEYFFFLILEYEINGGWMRSRLILPSSRACQIAIRENEQLSTYLNANLYCVNTNVLSKSIKPKLRPKQL